MPELPEVETVVRQLNLNLTNKTITNIQTHVKNFTNNIKEHLPLKIQSITRRGKLILINTNKGHLVTQLRMTGYFSYEEDKYKVVTFHFKDNTTINHHSIRKFGSIKYYALEQLETYLKRIGPEPLTTSPEQFTKLIQKYPNANLKNKLLDQSLIAGIGNIYAQEAMYYAKIHPTTQIKDAPKSNLVQLHKHMQSILKKAIKNKGTSIENYTHLDGTGNFQNLLAVYKQKICPKGHIIEKLKIAGRGTYYCKVCQNVKTITK
jgi:formamidopyrimidine-DNA glycosylase